jgi:hypothetical protein
MPPRTTLMALLPLLLASCALTPGFDDGAGQARPLAVWLTRGFAGRHRLACDDASAPVLEIMADGSSRLDGLPLVDSGHPGGLIIEGNTGSPAHREGNRIAYAGQGQVRALQVPAYPATVSLTLQRSAGAQGALVLTLMSPLAGGGDEITLSDSRHSRSCHVSGGGTTLAQVQPGRLVGLFAQQQEVTCRAGLARSGQSGIFSISREGQVLFPDGERWPLGGGGEQDWNFQLQDEGSFGGGGYRLLLDSAQTPRSMLGRQVSFDRAGHVQQMHYLASDGQSVDCRPI